MKEYELTASNDVVDQKQTDLDVDTIAEQIWSDLNGAATRSVIQETLKEVVPRYKNARIQTFVPIFIRRDAVERLQTFQESNASRS